MLDFELYANRITLRQSNNFTTCSVRRWAWSLSLTLREATDFITQILSYLILSYLILWFVSTWASPSFPILFPHPGRKYVMMHEPCLPPKFRWAHHGPLLGSHMIDEYLKKKKTRDRPAALTLNFLPHLCYRNEATLELTDIQHMHMGSCARLF